MANPSNQPDPATPAGAEPIEVIDLDGVDDLVEEMHEVGRYQPLLLVSQSGAGPGVPPAPRLDLDALQHAVGDAAKVVQLTPRAAHELAEQKAPHLAAWGGATKLVWPYATRTDPREDHPLFLTRAPGDSAATIARIVATLNSRGYPTPADHPRGRDLSAATTKTSAKTPGSKADPDADSKAGRLRKAAKELSDMRVDRDAHAERAAAAEAEVTALRREVRALRDQLAAATAAVPPVFADPADQFGHEVYLTWLAQVSEPDRPAQQLRDYTLGAEFIASLDADLIDRDRVLALVVEILTRTVFTNRAREPHGLRTSSVGNAPQRERGDGALAWRAALRTRTPAAPRIHWWELPDGTVELAQAAHHDDYRIR